MLIAPILEENRYTPTGAAGLTLWTIGHSTHPLEALVALLRAHGIDALADVRTVPRSRRHPQFEKATSQAPAPPPATMTS